MRKHHRGVTFIAFMQWLYYVVEVFYYLSKWLARGFVQLFLFFVKKLNCTYIELAFRVQLSTHSKAFLALKGYAVFKDLFLQKSFFNERICVAFVFYLL